MKKKIILLVTGILFAFLTVQGQTPPTVGDGSAGNPYEIANLENLLWLSTTQSEWAIGKYFIQTNDIDASTTILLDDGKGFSPIGIYDWGNWSVSFQGNYDGQGHIIDSLYINRTEYDYNALFGFLFGSASVRNLGVTNANINGNGPAALVGAVYSSTVTISNCYSTGSITSTRGYTGGLVGYLAYGTMNNCYTNSEVVGTSYAGTLIGRVQGGKVYNSYAAGSVSKTVGTIYMTSTGGFAGAIDNSAIVNNCYSTAFASGGYEIGGFVAYFNSATVSNCFWNTETSGQATSPAAIGKTTAEMQTLCTYIDGTEADWDFVIETINGTENIWGMNASENGGYPFLAWQGYEHTENCCNIIDLVVPETPTLEPLTGECLTVVTPTTTDNCAGTINGTTSDPTEYTLDGTYTITWTFDDGNGNNTTAEQTVIVDDVTAPETPTLADVTGECSATVIAPTTTDNCAGTITGTTSDPTEYTEQGTYTITWTFDDGNGNSTTAEQTVIVDDVTNPEITCVANQIINVDQTDFYTVLGTEFDPTGIFDNCEVASIENDFNISATLETAQLPLGTTIITWTIIDIAGNENTCSFDVTVDRVLSIETMQQQGISIYPNPTNGFVSFEFTDNNIQKLTVSDITGKEIIVKTQIQQNELLDLSNFESNIYIISIQTDKTVYSEKIIKK